ncbi:MAG: phosphatase PAP2 family protein [Coriobacteriia bacterium]|nr:phosphatase PAP2 family protein [Coriobacteriia bacterium]MBN2822561.1 phosphatase PAP2 family protein [Coriobacteriia bacterium]
MSPMVPRPASWRRDPRFGLLVIAFGIAVVSFVVLTVALLLLPAFVTLDAHFSEMVRGLSSPALEAVARFFTALGSFWPMALLTLGTSVYLHVRHREPEARLLLLTVPSAALLGEVLKIVVHRARPALELARIAIPDSYSFPSGHAVAATAFFGVLGFIALIGEHRLRRSALIVALCTLMVLSVGISRVYLGVHFLGDVVGGWLLGAAWVTMMIFLGATWGAGVPEKG